MPWWTERTESDDPIAWAAATGDEFGWFSPAPGAYGLRFTVVAATLADAREQAERRFTLPAHWGVSIDARPSQEL